MTAEERRQRNAEVLGQARPEVTGCAGCRHDGYGPTPPHDCESFPLPIWAPEYLSYFDRCLSLPTLRSLPGVIEAGLAHCRAERVAA